jgi:ribosomal 50S subunit-associated protein YjgA (DUF615 family)
MMPIAEVERVVGNVLQKHFRDEFVSFDVTPADDFDGEPVIRVLAHLKTRVDNIDELYRSVGAIRDELIKAGDNRFVFLDQDYPGAEEEYEEEDID